MLSFVPGRTRILHRHMLQRLLFPEAFLILFEIGGDSELDCSLYIDFHLRIHKQIIPDRVYNEVDYLSDLRRMSVRFRVVLNITTCVRYTVRRHVEG
jgi:hypothetical protein